MSRPTPLEDDRMALIVAALPLEYGSTRIIQLFRRGYQRYIVDGEPNTDDLIRDIERFGTAAFNKRVRHGAAETSFVDDPGTLAMAATLSAICVKAHSTFQEIPPRNIQVLYDIRELYVNNLASLLREFGDPSVQQDIAEVLYAKDPDEADGLHPGRVCTGITTQPEFGDGLHLEIPMVAASRKCLVRPPEAVTAESEDGDLSVEEESRAFLTRLKDNNLYVPIGDFDQKYLEYARGAFKRLLQTHEDDLTEEQRTWLTANETAISERIDSFLSSGHREHIWRNWDVGERLVRVLRKAINDYPDEDVQLGAFLSAKDLYATVEHYEPEQKWEEVVIRQISSPRSLGNLLARHRDHRLVEIRKADKSNEYKVDDPRPRRSEPLEIESIEDLFQLPCMANMEERLHREGPVRKDLFNFVRTVMWLPQYQDSTRDRIVEDIKTIFSRWPWYNEEITEYQVRYEYKQTIDGEAPLPMNCSNDDMQRYCIGQDVCPYSIYGSLPFSEKMYEQLDRNSGFVEEGF